MAATASPPASATPLRNSTVAPPRSLPATIPSPPNETSSVRRRHRQGRHRHRPRRGDRGRTTADRDRHRAAPRHPHATFHRHYASLVETRFRPRIPANRSETHPDQPHWRAPGEQPRRLRHEDTDSRRTLAQYEGPSGNSLSRATPCAAAAPTSPCPPAGEPPQHHSPDPAHPGSSSARGPAAPRRGHGVALTPPAWSQPMSGTIETTTLPALVRPCSTYAIASSVWSKGKVLSMTGRSFPLS